MWFKYPFIIALFFVAALLQVAFLPHFALLGAYPNLILTLYFCLIFFQKKRAYYEGIFFAFLAGGLLDVFSPFFAGASIMFFLGIFLLVKAILFLFREAEGRQLLLYFMGMFAMCLFLYIILMYGLTYLAHESPQFNTTKVIVSLIYNLTVALAGFFLYRRLSHERSRQLRLFH